MECIFSFIGSVVKRLKELGKKRRRGRKGNSWGDEDTITMGS